ncbi:sensor histidine kinase [Palleronia rufa]|uniref:sensor histidine kinase n=1 Tax=Palleronia rufa TaxID=1530186 RepID=UPI0005638EA9|nr:ATP-binding protein [Palleronia rufa]
MDGPRPQELLDALAVPALLIGRDHRIVAVNAGATEVFGRGLVGRHFVLALRQPALVEAIERTHGDGQPRDARFLARKDRTDLTFGAHVAAAGRWMLVSFEDRSAAEEADQMRRDFVANVSHELKTPLTAILGFIETLRGPARADAAARERFLTVMEREAQRMNRLVTDLLSLSRVEANERMRPTEEVDIALIVASCVTTLSGSATSRGVALVYDRPAAPVLLKGDGDQLRQVVGNLIENAVKYGGTRVEIRLTERLSVPELHRAGVVLDVIDNGPGIDERHLSRLTERFYRVDGHRSREVGGTGLGLAIVKHIVSRHRGRLLVASRRGAGTVFTALLPREP